MKRNAAEENTARVVAVALAFFGALAAIAFIEGVFDKFSSEALAALGIFALGFAAATYALDRGVRAWVNQIALRQARRERKGSERGLTKAPAKSPGGTPAAT